MILNDDSHNDHLNISKYNFRDIIIHRARINSTITNNMTIKITVIISITL